MQTDTNRVTRSVDFSQLPKPLLPSHREWVELYDFAWREAAKHIWHSRGRWHMDIAWDPTRNYQWVQDTCFVAMFCRYGAAQYPGIQSLDNFYELQREDGYIAMTYDMDTGDEVYPDRINPPLFAWTEWEYYRATGDGSRLGRVLPLIERHMDWIESNRRNRPHPRLASRGSARTKPSEESHYRLYYFADCGSSGMDDSPRTPRLAEAGEFFDWIDLSSQMVLSFRMLAHINGTLKKTGRAAYWSSRADHLARLINSELWCERTRFYHDRALPDAFVPHKTVAGFWPLLAGACPADRASDLVQHLKDESEFNRPNPVPTLSADDIVYSPEGTYWRGGVWGATNYMVARGLRMANRGEAAHWLAKRHLGTLARTYAAVEPHTIWECYSPESDRPGVTPYTGERVKPDFVGWTGVGAIAMLIENVLGIELDVPNGYVQWDVFLAEEHGIEDLGVGPGKASLFSSRRASSDEPARVRIRSDTPITVDVRRGEVSRSLRVIPGEWTSARV